MIRLRNTATGAVVSVPAEKAARLGGEWVPIEAPEPKPEPKKPATRRRRA